MAASFRRNDNNTIGAMYSRIAESWVAAGHQVVLINDGRRPSFESHDGRLVMTSWPSTRPTGLRDFLFLRRLISRYRPDLILSNYGSDNLCQLAGWVQGVPCRVLWHHTPTSQDRLDFAKTPLRIRFLMARKRWVYKLPTHFICGSTHTHEDLIETYHVPATKISLRRYLLPDPQSHTPAAAERDPNRIVFTGRFHPSKGQEFLIRALPLLIAAKPELRVDFIGDGPLRPTCEALAVELGVAQYCRFLGQVKHLHTIFEMVGHAAVSVAASLDEGFGLILIEAMAMGTPIVASDIPPFRGILVDGEDGFLFPPKDVEKLAERLLAILQDPELRLRLGEQARRHFLEKFSTEENAAAQGEFFAGLIPDAVSSKQAP